jgi:putative endonuclease
MYYTYVLLSEKDQKLYIGQTNDLKKRMQEHTDGKVQSTAFRQPMKLIYYEACLKESDSKKREKYFKTGYGRRFLRNRLENYFVDTN